ncbi:hypothetical protein pb186bvf_009726 [Paramecium bursaria]
MFGMGRLIIYQIHMGYLVILKQKIQKLKKIVEYLNESPLKILSDIDDLMN